MLSKLTAYLNIDKKQKIGTLAYKDRTMYFEYDKEFLHGGLELSPYKLPLREGLHICKDSPFDGLWGLFNDSLPDGWGRLLMDRHLTRLGVNAHSLNPLDRLAYIGEYGMGALGYEPCHEVETPSIDTIVLDNLAQSSADILEGSSDALVDTLLTLNGSSAGARPKAMIQLSCDHKEIIHGAQALREGFSHWMVKFASSSDSRETGAIEYAYSLMAKEAGLEMPPTALLEGRKGRYFGVERFDREGDKRVHIHSVAGLVHSDFRLPGLDYDDLLALTLHLTKNIQEVEKVFRLACFNLLSHNRDDHSKNFSFRMDEKGVWSFAPVYDITFSSGPGGEHSTMYLGEGKNPTREHLMQLGKKHRLRSATSIYDEVLAAIERWSEFAADVDISKTKAQQIERIFQKIAL